MTDHTTYRLGTVGVAREGEVAHDHEYLSRARERDVQARTLAQEADVARESLDLQSEALAAEIADAILGVSRRAA